MILVPWHGFIPQFSFMFKFVSSTVQQFMVVKVRLGYDRLAWIMEEQIILHIFTCFYITKFYKCVCNSFLEC
jgi:hypothetical protein